MWTKLYTHFADRLRWTELMAKKKDIELRILDETVSTTFHNLSDLNENQEGLYTPEFFWHFMPLI